MTVTAVCPQHDLTRPVPHLGCRCGEAVGCSRCPVDADRLVDGEPLCETCAMYPLHTAPDTTGPKESTPA